MQFFTTAAIALSALTSVVSANPYGPGKGFRSYHPASSAVTATVTATLTTTATTTVTASAAPTPTPLCLNAASANYLVSAYGLLLTAPQGPSFNSTVKAALSANFTDTSDSINWLAGIPLGSPTFASPAAFVGGQGSQYPIGFTVIETMFSCSEVSFRWNASVGLKKWGVKGINFFSTSNLNNTQAGYQILNMYSEFNVGAWETDIGRNCTPQGANQ